MNAITRPHVVLADEPELVDESGVYVSVGEIVGGKYRVEEVLGIGGMGFVVAATHIELEERFALKFLGQQFLGQPAVIDRFTQEARAACRLRSEHIARVHDVGVHEDAPFMVMEHLVGRDLAAVMAARGALPIAEAVEYVMQACEALAVAHRRGVVHRDIKPENLFLVEQEGLPSVKLLDFGISKNEGARAKRHTGNLTLGTPCYMAPEQIRSSADADARSDQWSLAVVLYELLTGTEAFRAPSINEVCAAVLEREPPALETVRDDVPPELVAVVRRCLAKSADDRFEDVAALAAALLPFGPSRSLVSAERSSSLMRAAIRRDVRVSTMRVAEVADADGPESLPASTRSVAVPPRTRRPLIAISAAIAVLGIVTFAAVQPLRRAAAHADPPVPPVTTETAPAEVVFPSSAPTKAAAPASAVAEIHEPEASRPSAVPAPKRTIAPVVTATASVRPRAPVPSATESAAPHATPTATGVELGY